MAQKNFSSSKFEFLLEFFSGSKLHFMAWSFISCSKFDFMAQKTCLAQNYFWLEITFSGLKLHFPAWNLISCSNFFSGLKMKSSLKKLFWLKVEFMAQRKFSGSKPHFWLWLHSTHIFFLSNSHLAHQLAFLPNFFVCVLGHGTTTTHDENFQTDMEWENCPPVGWGTTPLFYIILYRLRQTVLPKILLFASHVPNRATGWEKVEMRFLGLFLFIFTSRSSFIAKVDYSAATYSPGKFKLCF